MSCYQRFFAHLMALGDHQQEQLYGDRKRQLFADLQGTVLEIGPGTGVNLPYFPPDIHWIGLEPNPHMHARIREKAERLERVIDLRTGTAEATGLPAASVDTVVSTLVLCSVENVTGALSEIRRVLKPDGRFYFIEHIAAPEGTPRRTVQQYLRPLWSALADGCRPDQETGRLLDEAGFSEVRYERFPVGSPLNPIRPHIMGVAMRERETGSAGERERVPLR